MAVAIRQGTKRTGYKQTEAGLLPTDWVVRWLRDESEVITKGTTPTSLGRLFTSSGISFLKVESLDDDGNVVRDRVAYIDDKTNVLLKRSQLKENDIVISIAGALGRVGIVKRDILPANINQALAIIRLKPGASINHKFLFHYLKSAAIRSHIEAINVQVAQANLSLANIGDFAIPCPPLSEQESIASALSSTDDQITSLDQLIAKKRDLKTATMQRLLTGKRRLPGFGGEWEIKRLGDLGTTYGGLSGKNKADFGTGTARYIPFLNVIGNVVIDAQHLELVRVSASETQNRAQKGDLFFNGSSETPEEVGMCAVLLEDVENVYLNSFCFGFRLRNTAHADGLYLAYFFRSGSGRNLLYPLAQGSTRYNLSKICFLKLELPIPALREQKAIAEFLSDTDSEIAALEDRRDKARAMKGGMMQQLLNGSIRLV